MTIRRFFSFAFLAVGMIFPLVGCDHPEASPEELGTIVSEFPDLPDRPASLSLPEGVDEDCIFFKNAEKKAQLRKKASKAASDAARPANEAKPDAADSADETKPADNPAP